MRGAAAGSFLGPERRPRSGQERHHRLPGRRRRAGRALAGRHRGRLRPRRADRLRLRHRPPGPSRQRRGAAVRADRRAQQGPRLRPRHLHQDRAAEPAVPAAALRGRGQHGLPPRGARPHRRFRRGPGRRNAHRGRRGHPGADAGAAGRLRDRLRAVRADVPPPPHGHGQPQPSAARVQRRADRLLRRAAAAAPERALRPAQAAAPGRRLPEGRYDQVRAGARSPWSSRPKWTAGSCRACSAARWSTPAADGCSGGWPRPPARRDGAEPDRGGRRLPGRRGQGRIARPAAASSRARPRSSRPPSRRCCPASRSASSRCSPRSAWPCPPRATRPGGRAPARPAGPASSCTGSGSC